MAEVLKITLKKSLCGASQTQKATAQALGLSKIGKVVEQKDNPAIRGMIRKLSHLVTFEEA
ncbi:MAG: 50S ribosomal protein L30 [Fastidiosipilaceae bacterium]|jgi:large subunit ribosomal protein L30